MNFSERHQHRGKKWLGFSLVVAIHALALYALLTASGHRVTAVITQLPVQTKLISEEIKEEIQSRARPKSAVPPPKKIVSSQAYIPMPEAAVPQSFTPGVIQAETHDKPPAVQEVVPAQHKAPSVVPAVVDFSTCNKPNYPRDALRNEEQGTVRIQFLVGLDGSVAEAKIDQSSGFRVLDAAAKNALRLCKFKPSTVDGVPQQSWTTVNYVWKLPD